MKLYSGSSEEFINDVNTNIIDKKISNAFEEYYGHRANEGEIRAWKNSLQYIKNVLEFAKLNDLGIIIEYELPYSTKRIDCILFGTSGDQKNVVIIELKQWEKVEDTDTEGNVITYVGGGNREVLHPSYQVRTYTIWLRDFNEFFEDTFVRLSACSYLHNYSKKEMILFSEKFSEVINEFPIFTRDDFKKLGDYLKSKLKDGKGLELLNRFNTSNIKPSKKLLEHVKDTIKGNPTFNLIDDQLVAYNRIISCAKKAQKTKGKSVIIVEGGPGTGKSVIALNILAELASRGIHVFHATGSRAFTSTLRKIVGTRASTLFRYTHQFPETKVKENEIDVLICDEAHRIRKTSNYRFTKKEFRSNTPQVDQLIRSSKVSVFFIDNYQIVRPEEIGNTELIKEAAKKFGAKIYEYKLKTQFRCSGSDGYLNWIDNTLGIRDTANRILTKDEKMEFKIFDSPEELYNAIKEKNKERPNSARLVAGFCWPWSHPRPDGTLVNDVVIGNFKMPWEGKPGKKLAKGIPPASLWAYDPNGVNQIGCIYTIQGFEFDYVGVIFGKDLMYDWNKKEWVGHRENSADPAVKRAKNFTQLIKNTYRVLLTRGMKGCYVYFLDKNTERFFRSRIEEYFKEK
ncbi:MAG: DNA/RNA helicase domain-containing protein [Candidatus Heimdallarchaeaceae archaeon]